MSRLRAYVFGGGLLLATAYPVTFPLGRDSYPLSSYPMFAYARGRSTVYFAQATGAEQRPRRIPPDLIGSHEVMQAAVTVRQAVQGGRGAMRQLCRHIAARAAEDVRLAGAQRIELMSAEFDPVAYFEQGQEARALRRHQRCPVGGGR